MLLIMLRIIAILMHVTLHLPVTSLLSECQEKEGECCGEKAGPQGEGEQSTVDSMLCSFLTS